MNIFEKMLAIENEIRRVQKNLKVEMGKGSYKAVSEGDILEAVKPLEEKYKVFSYPVLRKIIETNVLTTVKEYNGNKTESNQLFMRIEVTYRFVNAEKPEEYVEVMSYGDGVDSQDKAPGKAMTYADKYALMKGYKIETGDDPDQEGSGELKSVIKNKITDITLIELMKVVNEDDIDKINKFYNIKSVGEMTEEDAQKIIKKKRG